MCFQIFQIEFMRIMNQSNHDKRMPSDKVSPMRLNPSTRMVYDLAADKWL